MPELTLESLAARVAELERKAAATAPVVPPVRDWRSVVGTFEETEFSRQVDAEVAAARDAQRRVAELTNVPELADNPGWEAFLQAMRDNREQMAREDAERWAAEDAAAQQAGWHVAVYVLDTDTLSLHQHGHHRVRRQVTFRAADAVALSVWTVEEQPRGPDGRPTHHRVPPPATAGRQLGRVPDLAPDGRQHRRRRTRRRDFGRVPGRVTEDWSA